MKSYRSMAVRLKGIVVIGSGLIVLAYLYFVPNILNDMVQVNPSFHVFRNLILVITWLTSLFIVSGLYQLWKLCESLAVHLTFTLRNVRRLQVIARCASSFAFIYGVYFVFALGFGFRLMSVLVITLFTSFGALAIAVVASILAEIMLSGFDLQDEQTLTI